MLKIRKQLHKLEVERTHEEKKTHVKEIVIEKKVEIELQACKRLESLE